MREILFRGKNKNTGEWIKGYYFKTISAGEHIHCIISIDKYYKLWGKRFKAIGGATEVDEKTVGQYTGMTDRNGKKIFENDIIKDSETGEIFKIFYNWDRFSKTNDSHYFLDLSLRIYECEVIGNIYDNPELLK